MTVCVCVKGRGSKWGRMLTNDEFRWRVKRCVLYSSFNFLQVWQFSQWNIKQKRIFPGSMSAYSYTQFFHRSTQPTFRIESLTLGLPLLPRPIHASVYSRLVSAHRHTGPASPRSLPPPCCPPCGHIPHGRPLLPLQTLLSLSLHNTGFSWFSFCLARLLLLFFTFSPFSTHPRKPGFLGAQTLSFIKSFFRWFTDPYRFEEWICSKDAHT